MNSNMKNKNQQAKCGFHENPFGGTLGQHTLATPSNEGIASIT